MSQLVKNLKMMPTSTILLATYNHDVSLDDKEVSLVLTRRLEKKYKLNSKTIRGIINQDYQVFDTRGQTIYDYAFAPGHDLDKVLDRLYDQIFPFCEGKFVISKRAINLSFSEVAFASVLFKKLERQYAVSRNSFQGNEEEYCEQLQLHDFYQYLKETLENSMRIQMNHDTFITKPSFQSNLHVMNVGLQEALKINNIQSSFSDMRHIGNGDTTDEGIKKLIRKHPNMERVYELHGKK